MLGFSALQAECRLQGKVCSITVAFCELTQFWHAGTECAEEGAHGQGHQ